MTEEKVKKIPPPPQIELIGPGGRKCVPLSELDYWTRRGYETAPAINPPKKKAKKATAPPLPPPTATEG